MKYYKFFKFLESKDRFIDNNPNLSTEQKVEIKSFFQKHPNYESRIDWNKAKSLTYEDFKSVLALEGKSVSAVKKGAGIQGLTEGRDYILLGKGVFNGEEWYAYQPLTYYASRLIASKHVKPEVEAAWCTAYQKDREYWDKHAFENKESFIYLCGESIPTEKVAITASTLEKDSDDQKYSYHLESGLNFSIWNADDEKVRIIKKLPNEVLALIPKSYDNRDLVIQFHDADVKKTEEIERQKAEIERQKAELRKPVFNRSTGRWDVRESLLEADLEQYIENGKFTIPFGVIEGDFKVPNGLTSHSSIASLENCPTEVRGIFDCSWNRRLTSLEGAPKKVEDFFCSFTGITSLEGAPEEVVNDFSCRNCNNLTSLKGAPKHIGGEFFCDFCENLTSLEGAPRYVGGDFGCDCTNLTSLAGAPEEVEGNFSCYKCTSLVSLKGVPKKIKGKFRCESCENLTSLEGAPKYVGGDFDCKWCGKEFTEDDVRAVCDVKGSVYC